MPLERFLLQTSDCGATRHQAETCINRPRDRAGSIAFQVICSDYGVEHRAGNYRVELSIPQKRCDKAVLGFLSRPEMEAIIAAPDQLSWVGQRDRAMFTMLYNTGARVSEIIDLRIGNVVLDVAPVAHLQGKGRKRRSTQLWKPTAAAIRAWVRQLARAGETDYLFPSSSGSRLSRSAVTQRLALAVQHATQMHPRLADRAI